MAVGSLSGSPWTREKSAGVGAVQVELDEVGAVIELGQRGREQFVPVPGLHAETGRQQPGDSDPGSGHGEQPVRRVAAPVDPVRAAGQGQVAVPVDHPGHDRGAARVHDLAVGGQLTFVVRGADGFTPG
jgi:hypothetical protein